jgi:hypothetical protein
MVECVTTRSYHGLPWHPEVIVLSFLLTKGDENPCLDLFSRSLHLDLETLFLFLDLQEVILCSNMRVDLSRVQQASALMSDSDESDREFPPEWDARNESFDDYYDRAQEFLHRDDREDSLPSPFLRPHERVPTNARDTQGRHLLFSSCPLCEWNSLNLKTFQFPLPRNEADSRPTRVPSLTWRTRMHRNRNRLVVSER